jgi:hypothetical protein
MLKIDWYIEQPIDFEYKNYMLLDYVQKVDRSFQLKELSPYLLWTENLIQDMKDFESKRLEFVKKFETKKIKFENGNLSLIKKTIIEPENIKTIKEIIEYASPILESKVKMGYILLKKYPQILF